MGTDMRKIPQASLSFLIRCVWMGPPAQRHREGASGSNALQVDRQPIFTRRGAEKKTLTRTNRCISYFSKDSY